MFDIIINYKLLCLFQLVGDYSCDFIENFPR